MGKIDMIFGFCTLKNHQFDYLHDYDNGIFSTFRSNLGILFKDFGPHHRPNSLKITSSTSKLVKEASAMTFRLIVLSSARAMLTISPALMPFEMDHLLKRTDIFSLLMRRPLKGGVPNTFSRKSKRLGRTRKCMCIALLGK